MWKIFEMKNHKKSKGSPQKVHYQIVFVTYLFVTIFIGMMGYICYYSVTNKQVLLNNSYNTRQQLLAAKNKRGDILSADGKVLARTVTGEEEKDRREYPFGPLFSHVVGYATNGRMGVEDLGNYYLIQSNAPLSEKAANDVAGEKYEGDHIITTLDTNLQTVASNALGVYKGAIVVTQPSTGKILAMVSKPDFDPNEIETLWDSLVADQESGVLLNRVTQGMYPPGSTFKIITALEYIRENPDSYQNYQFQCSGHFTSGEERINCYHGQSHGSVNLDKAFAKSCNAAFADMGLKLSMPEFQRTLKELMFQSELPIPLNYMKSRIDLSAEIETADVMQIAIGQGTTGMSPMHLNMVTSAVANGGVLMKPYLIDRVENSKGSLTKQFSPSTHKRLMSASEAEALDLLMTGVVENGTGTKLKGLSYTAAGKTGSAEYSSEKSESHAWFTGFAPAENPEICVTIIIEGAGSGGDYAVPIAKRVFDAYFGVS